MTRSAPSKDLLQAVSFRLGQEEYALEITQVKEVIMPTGIMRMPQTATFNVGVINLRGTIIPVIDLRLRLGVGEATTDDHTRILIAKPAGRTGSATVGGTWADHRSRPPSDRTGFCPLAHRQTAGRVR